ncbi:hypothetical protein [Paenibacillus hunanensis]|uniref:Uncharacterized protein n=1 Tax=Paenibacillus hunanensis TaxID=539262 RepID=A0ABU1J820_9BACL|nr:hypothetical protein [Paenibacillus hunanensis]MDR6246608.1 hypothetical protein [Paenibacillus hunanensis]
MKRSFSWKFIVNRVAQQASVSRYCVIVCEYATGNAIPYQGGAD